MLWAVYSPLFVCFKVLEGEVVTIEYERPASGGPKIGRITMKTTDMETVYDIGNKMVESCIKEKISSGDVIQIDKSSGIILLVAVKIALKMLQ